MGNRGTISISGSGGGGGSSGLPDVPATTFVASFKSGQSGNVQSGGARYATQVVLNSGESPSYGFVGMPINTFGDEAAPAVALKKSGVAGRVPPNTRVKFDFINGSKTKTVMSGTLVQYVHVIGEDSALALVFDDKWLLSKITVFGRATYDPRTRRYWFDAGEKCIFNELGFPNCIDSPFGPRFAPSHRFGYLQTTFSTPSSARSAARHWTVSDALEYLRDMHYASSGNRPMTMEGYGRNVVPHWVDWPSGLSHVIGSTRVVQDLDLDAQSLLHSVAAVLRRAGAYDLYCQESGFNSVLKVVNMNPSTGSGGQLILPSYDSSLDVGGLINTANVIHSGYINESIINYSHEVTICGDPVCVERFLTTANAGDATTVTAMPAESLGGLEPAWDRGSTDNIPVHFGTAPTPQSDEWKFLDYIQNHPDHPNSQQAFTEARNMWPDVFVAYQVPVGYNVFLNTKWSNTFNCSSHARFRASLLTGDNQDSTNPGNWISKPVTIEYESTPNTGVWTPAQRSNGLELSPDGRSIRLQPLADLKQTWYQAGTGGAYEANSGGTKMKPRHIRMSCVLESDWRITGRATGDPNRTGGRVGGDKYTYIAVSGPLQYIEWLRDKSYPNGGSRAMGGGIDAAIAATITDKASGGNELFTDRTSATVGRLPKHATIRLSDVKRIEYTGQLIIQMLNPAMKPGLPVSIEGNGTLQTFSVVKSVTFDSGLQITIIDLSNQDSAVIFDIPSAPAKPPQAITSDNDKPQTDTGTAKETVTTDNSKPATATTTDNSKPVSSNPTTSGSDNELQSNMEAEYQRQTGQQSSKGNGGGDKTEADIERDQEGMKTEQDKYFKSKESSQKSGDLVSMITKPEARAAKKGTILSGEEAIRNNDSKKAADRQDTSDRASAKKSVAKEKDVEAEYKRRKQMEDEEEAAAPK